MEGFKAKLSCLLYHPLCVVCVCEYTLALTSNTDMCWSPQPHVNSENGGLMHCGNCCLSVQWKEWSSCNGPPVGSVCKLLCVAAVWRLPSELSISVLCWLTAPDLDGISSVKRLFSVKVSQSFSYAWRKWGSKIFQVHLCCLIFCL